LAFEASWICLRTSSSCKATFHECDARGWNKLNETDRRETHACFHIPFPLNGFLLRFLLRQKRLIRWQTVARATSPIFLTICFSSASSWKKHLRKHQCTTRKK
jgi:hypothetical protein